MNVCQCSASETLHGKGPIKVKGDLEFAPTNAMELILEVHVSPIIGFTSYNHFPGRFPKSSDVTPMFYSSLRKTTKE